MITIPNCTISYNVILTTPQGEDPITGEPLFETSTTSESFRASLEKDTTEPNIGNLPGKDKNKHFYSGKADLTPSEMPSWFKRGSTVSITFDDGVTVEAYVYYAPQPTRLNLDNFFGATIEVAVNY